MGNLPCCNTNEQQKPTAFATHNSSSSDGPLTSSLLLSNSKAQAMSSPSQNSDHNLSNYKSSSSPSDHAEKYQLLEQQQRALLQKEQERLERIVNDAGWAMVHVNGTAGGISTSGGIGGGIGFSGGGIGGGGGGGGSNMKNILMGNGGGGSVGGNISTTTRAMGYYDANYAAEVWQDLLPGRNGGGLIAMCQNEMDLKQDKQQTQKQHQQQEHQEQQQQQQQQQQQSHASLWKTVPKGAFLDSSQILESLNHHGTLGGGRIQLWTDESVRLLDELITTDPTNRYTHASSSSSSLPLQLSSSVNGGDMSMTSTVMNEGESMERLVDDLAEKFLASVFQEGRLDGLAPIVENVL